MRDTTTRVWWLQGPRLFIDLRLPASPPDFSGLRGLEDLSAAQCMWLARQQGFAGQLVHYGTCFEWQRSLDFQPDSQQPDVGTLHWESAVLIERGRDSPYIEHWHRDQHSLTAPSCSVSLQATDSDAGALLLVVGTVFMFARGRKRETPLPLRRTLSECVAEAQSLAEMQALLDCEISFGAVRDRKLHITASTLPYRVGDVLDPYLAGDAIRSMDGAKDGKPVQRHWKIIAAEGAMDSLRNSP
jgi:hypothetical protein